MMALTFLKNKLMAYLMVFATKFTKMDLKRNMHTFVSHMHTSIPFPPSGVCWHVGCEHLPKAIFSPTDTYINSHYAHSMKLCHS